MSKRTDLLGAIKQLGEQARILALAVDGVRKRLDGIPDYSEHDYHINAQLGDAVVGLTSAGEALQDASETIARTS